MVSNLIFHFFCCVRILGLSFRPRKIAPNGSGKDNVKIYKIYKYYSNNIKPYNFYVPFKVRKWTKEETNFFTASFFSLMHRQLCEDYSKHTTSNSALQMASQRMISE